MEELVKRARLFLNVILLSSLILSWAAYKVPPNIDSSIDKLYSILIDVPVIEARKGFSQEIRVYYNENIKKFLQGYESEDSEALTIAQILEIRNDLESFNSRKSLVSFIDTTRLKISYEHSTQILYLHDSLKKYSKLFTQEDGNIYDFLFDTISVKNRFHLYKYYESIYFDPTMNFGGPILGDDVARKLLGIMSQYNGASSKTSRIHSFFRYGPAKEMSASVQNTIIKEINKIEKLAKSVNTDDDSSIDDLKQNLQTEIQLPLINEKISTDLSIVLISLFIVLPMLLLFSVFRTISSVIQDNKSGISWVFFHAGKLGLIMGIGQLFLPFIATIFVMIRGRLSVLYMLPITLIVLVLAINSSKEVLRARNKFYQKLD